LRSDAELTARLRYLETEERVGKEMA